MRQRAREEDRLLRELGGDVDLEDGLLRPAEADAPGVLALGAAADELEVADPEQPLGLADRLLRGLDLEAVRGAAAVALELDPSLLVGSQQAAGVLRLDPAVVAPAGRRRRSRQRSPPTWVDCQTRPDFVSRRSAS